MKMIDISRASKQEKDDALKESKALWPRLGLSSAPCVRGTGLGVLEAPLHSPVQGELQRGLQGRYGGSPARCAACTARTGGSASSWTTVKGGTCPAE